MTRRTLASMTGAAGLVAAALALAPTEARAQYAETARLLPVVNGTAETATQIGRRLFIGGHFTRVAPPTGSVALFDAQGQLVPTSWPVIGGPVQQIIGDGLGGWIAVGGFTTVDGRPHAGLVHVTGAGQVDPRIRIVADGPVSHVVLAHGRIYIAGPFATVNGARRLGLAAIDASSGTLTSWGVGFAVRQIHFVYSLSASSIGVYVSVSAASGGGTWGLAADDGRVLFHLAPVFTALAPTSVRLYVAGYSPSTRDNRVWALDPLTGEDVPWTSSVRFQYLSSTYGDRTYLRRLVLEGDTLYLGGSFITLGSSREHLLALSASTGELLPWRPLLPRSSPGLSEIVLTPQSIAVIHGLQGVSLSEDLHYITAFDRATAAATPWPLPVFGQVTTLAPTASGVAVGGAFGGVGGARRAQLAAIDLDSGTLDPWLPGDVGPAAIAALDTDGVSLFAARQSFIPFPGPVTIDRIDPADGRITASLEVGGQNFGIGLRMRTIGSRLYVWGNFTSIGGQPRSGLGAIDTATWSVLPWAPTVEAVASIDALGSTVYLAGRFRTIGGVPRQGLAAVDADSGALLPWNPEADVPFMSGLRVYNGRVIVSGEFRRIAGVRRRSLAALDPVTAQATSWNPDVPPGINEQLWGFSIDASGIIYTRGRPLTTIGGRAAANLAALSAETGARLPWRLPNAFSVWPPVALPDCLFISQSLGSESGGVINGFTCLPPLAPPATLAASVSGESVSLTWSEGGPPSTAYRVDVGHRSEQSDVGAVMVPAGQTGVTGTLPAGSYVARVRAVAGEVVSMPSPDVSFAIAPPDATGAPLDLTAVTEGLGLRLTWRPPTVGTPSGYTLEVGSAEGLHDLASIGLAGTATSFVLDAPPGRYWARLKATATSGALSTPSNEVFISIDAHSGGCAAPPLAPSNLAATVVGRVVTLLWQQPATGPVANTQRIMVGSTPGADDLGAFGAPGPATRFDAPAPPGTYFVRVVALNECGASPVSNEVTIVVP